ncbi:MAG: hypothetical protein IK143_00555, partial [Bacteroidales bacterium]|nr:hypothetical protein [Bacteroidales bacterium]
TLTTAASGSSPDITSHNIDLLVNVKAHDSGAQIYPSAADEDEYAVARVYIPASQTFEAGKSYTVTLNLSTGLGVSMSNLSLYNGSSSDLSSSLDSENFVKNVSSEFPDNSFILGSAMDFTVTSTDWVAAMSEVLEKAPKVPLAALPGLFTVNSEGQKVYFSKGNLMCYVNGSYQPTAAPEPYEAATTGWCFHDNQYDYFGATSANLNARSGWVDWFGYSGSGANWGIRTQLSNSYFGGDFRDWGANRICNGTSMDPVNTWRCLTGGSGGEFTYILKNRTTNLGLATADARYATGKVATVSGLIIFPDEWVSGSELNATQKAVFPAWAINLTNPNFDAFSITAENWPAYEDAGCVFIPAAGSRSGTEPFYVGYTCYVWSSSCVSSDFAYGLFVNVFTHQLEPDSAQNRLLGCSVRLVRNK